MKNNTRNNNNNNNAVVYCQIKDIVALCVIDHCTLYTVARLYIRLLIGVIMIVFVC